MDLIPPQEHARLLANGRARAAAIARNGDSLDHVPVVKLFTPDAGATWLLSAIDPDRPDIAFGLCDLGLGCPEIGPVSLREVRSLRGALGLPVERDLYARLDRPLSVYAALAQVHGHIVLDP